jgi:hypothetical protein
MAKVDVAPVREALAGDREVDRGKFGDLKTVRPEDVQPALDVRPQAVDDGHHADHGKHADAMPSMVRPERSLFADSAARSELEAEDFGPGWSMTRSLIIHSARPPPDRVCSPARPGRTR